MTSDTKKTKHDLKDKAHKPHPEPEHTKAGPDEEKPPHPGEGEREELHHGDDDPVSGNSHEDGDDENAVVQAQLEDMKDKMLRALAESENVKRRSIEQVNTARLYALEGFARDLLDIADNLDRALEAHHQDQGIKEEADKEQKDNKDSAFFEGVVMTRKALTSVFERHGVKEERPLHKAFDPHRHQAIAHLPSQTPAGHIADVMQAGYYLKDRVLRAAMVVVSTGEKGEETEDNTKDNEDKADREA